jgi:Thiamine pyrophosphate-requiring enzymes [acetolactate synthase, pyruvate dehydrogenase (cytochrome), glyoxylate carboligase, phosphonopyruvate decarboxylase]
MPSITGGGLIAAMLAAEGVEVVFGIIDGTYFGLYAAFEEHGIRLVGPRHESSAAHMAGAYARLTGKLGVCMASNGPGVANVLPGVAVENGEGNRVLLLTSSRRTGITYPDRGGTFQYFNQVAVTRPMTKWSATVSSFERIPEIMRRAFRTSFKGRPGVVHVDVAENILNGSFKLAAPDVRPPSTYRRVTPIPPDPELVRRSAGLLTAARLPVIHAGNGVIAARAFDELVAVAELLRAPVTTSWAGRSAQAETHELAIPMIHVELNRRVRNDADVVLALGTRLGETDWWGKPPYWRSPEEQKLIQVDVDEDVLGMNKPLTLGVLADVRAYLAALRAELGARDSVGDVASRNAKIAGYRTAIARHRAELDRKLTQSAEGVHPSHVATTCRRVFDDDAILVIDGGNTAVWANFYHEVRAPNTVLTTPKFGMLGAGVSQALGARIACPERQVYCIIGDGAMGFHPQEVETAVRNDLPVIYLVLCDRQWGMVKMTQQFQMKPLKTLIRKSLGPEETINTDLGEIRFDLLAESMGAHGERVSAPEELEPALRRCLEGGRCSVIHVDVDPVAHMWAPSLKHFKDMHQEPKG